MRERNLGTNGSSSARPCLNEGAQQRLTGFLVLTTAVEDMFSVRDKIVPRLVCRGTHTGPYGGIEAVGKRVEVPDSAVWPVRAESR
jgi:predicted ester cyclase